ncbi:unnamed protein product [Meganyctiphanes norvegica]|uniref:Cuticle protein n=1 Tax=Meganyctiphanes norvegica TaxID=48144 RepID=A0AAV2Q7V5_MEGNR
MNPLMLLPLMAMGCAAAPHGVVALHGAALPYAGTIATHTVTHNVPSAVEYKQVGDVLPVAAHLGHVAAIPGYTVNGEIRTVDTPLVAHTPLVSHAGVYAHHGLVHSPLAAYPAVVAAEAADEEDKTVAVHSYALPAAVGYSGLGVHGLGLHGLGYNGLGYNGLGLHGLGLHGLGYHGLPVVAAAAAEESEE